MGEQAHSKSLGPMGCLQHDRTACPPFMTIQILSKQATVQSSIQVACQYNKLASGGQTVYTASPRMKMHAERPFQA